MEEVTRFAVALVLFILILSFLLGFLAGPISVLRKAGVLKALRWFIKILWRSLILLFQLGTKTRRLHIRRPGARHAPRRTG